jgi:hypothetical protein
MNCNLQGTLDVPLSQQAEARFENVWLRDDLKNVDNWDSYPGLYTGTSVERESLRLSRMPSLSTNISSGLLSLESFTEIPEIYGASQWCGIVSLGSKKKHVSDELIGVGGTSQLATGSEERSSGLESICGTSPVTTHEKTGPQGALWVDYGNLVTQAHGVPNFPDQLPFFMDHADIAQMPPAQLNTNFPITDANVVSPDAMGHGETHDPQLTPESTSFSSAPNNFYLHTPRSGMTTLDSADFSPTSQEFVQYTPLSGRSPTSILSLSPTSQEVQSRTSMELTDENMLNDLFPQTLRVVPGLFSQLSGMDSHVLADERTSKNISEDNWNCFVIEDGRGRVDAPPSARPKGKKCGPQPIEKAIITRQRRREGKTCVKCKVARVSVCSPFGISGQIY